MNEEKIRVNTVTGILPAVSPKKHPFEQLLDWLRARGYSANVLAEKSGAFHRSALTMQKNKERPNPGLDVIHGIAKVAKIPEQMVIDACLGRPFPTSQELEDATLKEAFRKYQMIDESNRGESLNYAITMLLTIIDDALETQESKKARR